MEEVISKVGRDALDKAKSEGLVEIEGDEVKLTQKGRNTVRVVLAGGVFDIIHPGHVFFLAEAKKLGDFLIVVVARDETARKNKIVVVPAKQRVRVVRALKPVDAAIVGRYEDIFKTLYDIKPDVVVLGYDQHHLAEGIEKEAERGNLRIEVVKIKEKVDCELSSTRAILRRIIELEHPLREEMKKIQNKTSRN